MPKIEKDLLKVKGSDGQWHYIPAVGGGDTPTWEMVQNKPFSTLGSGLSVDKNGVLSAEGGGGGGSGGEAVKFAVKSSANVVVSTKDGQTPVEAGGDEVVLEVNVGDILVISVAPPSSYFAPEGGSGYKELGSYPTVRRMYVYWILIEGTGDLMLS